MQYAVFFSNNLLLNKVSSEVVACKWSAVAGVSFLGFGSCRSPGSGLFSFGSPRVWNAGGLCGSGASDFGFHSFGAFRRYLASGSPAYGRGAISVFQFGAHSF